MNGLRRAIVPLCAALCAALVAHVAIDVAGDYLLAHDTYDALAHDSRELVGFGALLLALAAAAAALRAALAEARGSERVFCAAVRAALGRSFARFIAVVVALTFSILCAMEALDSLLAHVPIDDAGDLLGGSFLLGAGLTVLCGLAGAAVSWFAVCRIARAHVRIVRILAALVRSERAPHVRARTVRRPRIRPLRANLVLARRLAGRAPPRLA